MRPLYYPLQIVIVAATIIASTHASANCLTVDPSQVKATWTAYKFTEKKAVTGSFSKIKIELPKDPKNDADLIRGTHAVIDSLSVETGDLGRNANIAQGFFAKMKKGTEVQVSFAKPKKDSVEATLKMNGASKKLKFKISRTENEMNLEATADIVKTLGLSESFESIQTLCKELHKGTDGVTKTWSEVAFKVTVPFSCPAK